MSFWQNIPPWAKWDEIEEVKHNHILKPVLNDCDTGVSWEGRDDYILYDRGGLEALLYRPTNFLNRISMRILYAILCIAYSK